MRINCFWTRKKNVFFFWSYSLVKQKAWILTLPQMEGSCVGGHLHAAEWRDIDKSQHFCHCCRLCQLRIDAALPGWHWHASCRGRAIWKETASAGVDVFFTNVPWLLLVSIFHGPYREHPLDRMGSDIPALGTLGWNWNDEGCINLALSQTLPCSTCCTHTLLNRTGAEPC